MSRPVQPTAAEAKTSSDGSHVTWGAELELNDLGILQYSETPSMSSTTKSANFWAIGRLEINIRPSRIPVITSQLTIPVSEL